MGVVSQQVAVGDPRVDRLVLQLVSAGGLRVDKWTLQPGAASGLRRDPFQPPGLVGELVLQLVSAGGLRLNKRTLQPGTASGLRGDPFLPREPGQTHLVQEVPLLAGVQGSGGQDGVVGQLVHHPVLLECLCRIHSL